MTLVMPKPIRDPKSGIYYLRVRVPADVVAHFGKREVSKSLRTRDPGIAKERFVTEYAALQKRWARARAKPQHLPLKEIVALASQAYYEWMDLLEDEPGEPEIWQHVLRLGNQAATVSNGLETWYGTVVDKMLDDAGIEIDAHTRRRMLEQVHKAYTQAAEQQLKRAYGDFSPDPKADRFPKPKAQNATDAGPTLTTIFKRWEKDHISNGKSPRTVNDFAQKMDALISYLGHEDIQKITPQDISQWCDHLRHDKGLSAKTVGTKYLAAIRAIFRLARSKFLVASDPTEGVTIKVPKAVTTRPKGFTDDETKQILSCADKVFAEPSRASHHNKLACRWVPWVCAYTGARAGEITQLRKQDVSVTNGIAHIRITPEAGTVKAGRYRIVPLHPHLEELGFIDFVTSSPEGNLFHNGANTSEMAVKKAGNARDKVSKWVREIVGITDARIQPNHAWRHRFSTKARDAAISREYRTAIQGHADGSAAEGYGEYSVESLYREICKLPKIDLS